MTREEHIKWCKERAIVEMDYYKDPKKGIISMMSDIRKHPETNSEALAVLCMIELMNNPHMSRQQVINFINEFN
jgi:prenyltransferase beta subunit